MNMQCSADKRALVLRGCVIGAWNRQLSGWVLPEIHDESYMDRRQIQFQTPLDAPVIVDPQDAPDVR